MSVLAQTFFTFVRCHFMSFTFFTAGHNKKKIKRLFLHSRYEYLCRLEGRNVVGGDCQRGVLGDVPSSLLRAMLDDETSKPPEVNGVTLGERILHGLHKCLNYCLYLIFLNAG